MNINFEKLDLTPALDLVNQIAKEKTTVPIYSSILITAKENGDIFLGANDSLIALESKVPGEVTEAGSIAIPAKRFHTVVSALSNDHPVSIVKQPGHRVLITSGKGKYRIAGLSPEQFPEMVRLSDKPDDENVMILDGYQFRTSIDQTAYAAATEANKGLDSICFAFSENELEVVATDGNVAFTGSLRPGKR